MTALAAARPGTRASVAVAMAAAGVAAAAIASGPAGAPLALACGIAAVAATRWRAGVVVLVVALPFAGVPALLAGTPGLAARDVFIIAPLYTAFALAMLRAGERIFPPVPGLTWALGAFAALVMAHALLSPGLLVALIGIKVWLAYIPLLAIGYHYVRSERDFEACMRITALLGLVPALVGIAEFALGSTRGDFGPLEALYARQPLDETYRWVTFTTPDGALLIPRVPSLFTGVTQFYGFTVVAFACALALALRRASAAWCACATVLAFAAVASGARAAYVMVPGVALLSLLLSGPRPSTALLLAGGAGAVVAVLVAAGAPVAAVAWEMPSHISESWSTAWREMTSGAALMGHGTGWDTNAALRYGGAGEQRYIENWYAKAVLETGIAGLASLVVALVALIGALLWRVSRAAAPQRALAAPVAAMLTLIALSLLKGPYVDLDPTNVYFWLLAGMLFGLLRKHSDQGAAR